MKKFCFALLFFSAIAWLWIGHMMGADGTLANVAGTTTTGGAALSGTAITNNWAAANGTIVLSNGVYVTNSSGAHAKIDGAIVSAGPAGLADRAILDGSAGGSLSIGPAASSSQWKITASGTPAKITWARGDGGTAAAWSINSTGVSMGSNDVAATSSMDVYGAANIFGRLNITNSLIMPTNYVAAQFAPVAGMVKIVVSNGVFWKVTQLTTNLFSQDIP